MRVGEGRLRVFGKGGKRGKYRVILCFSFVKVELNEIERGVMGEGVCGEGDFGENSKCEGREMRSYREYLGYIFFYYFKVIRDLGLEVFMRFCRIWSV